LVPGGKNESSRKTSHHGFGRYAYGGDRSTVDFSRRRLGLARRMAWRRVGMGQIRRRALLGNLLIGSMPGIILDSYLATRARDAVVRIALASTPGDCRGSIARLNQRTRDISRFYSITN
jgi:hypothetical protein